ncbi:MAG: prolipoprotein diacylglyceryl transferase [Bdellovibrionaceae bacterium]|nr:prolipoprotein diacylglyceryl transferase [Pseudobdellovibrionaceae bacterium]
MEASQAAAAGIYSPDNFSGWVHRLDPFIIQFTEHFGIRWYGMAYLTGFMVGYYLMVLIARRGRNTLPEEQLSDFVLAIVLGTMIGGRVGYAVFYSQDLLTDFSTSFPFWGVLRVWEGGMASHGGILGIILAAVYFAKTRKANWLHLGDLTTLGGCVGIFAGRVANFINGELYGRPVASSLSWAVKFPSEAYLWLKHDAEKSVTDLSPDLLPRLQDAVSRIGIASQDWLTWCSQVRTNLSARNQIQHGIDRLIAATQESNSAVIDALEPVLTARHPSQLYEALLEGALLFVITFLFWRKPKKPGIVGGVWLTLYAIVRIIGEQFRMPDAHIGYQLFGLTRGQWISAGMIFVSLGILIYAIRKPGEQIGGWEKSS